MQDGTQADPALFDRGDGSFGWPERQSCFVWCFVWREWPAESGLALSLSVSCTSFSGHSDKRVLDVVGSRLRPMLAAAMVAGPEQASFSSGLFGENTSAYVRVGAWRKAFELLDDSDFAYVSGIYDEAAPRGGGLILAVDLQHGRREDNLGFCA